MNRNAIARRLAKEMNVPTGYAADQIDRLVHEIVKNLKNGQEVKVPGFGIFLPGKNPHFRSESRRAK